MKNRFRYRGATALLLGLSLIVPVGSAFAAETGEWRSIGVKKRSYFVPDGDISRQRTVLSASEKLVSTVSETERGRWLSSGVEKLGTAATKDVADPAKDKVQIIPGAAEPVGNDWVEYETVRRQKALQRTYTQQEQTYSLYAEQARKKHTYQVTEKVQIVETWTDPVSKQQQRNVVDTTETRNDLRYTGWTETGNKLRVNAGTSTRTWGPELVYTAVPDEQRVKRSPLTPPGGMSAGWWLTDNETFRYFVAGSTPPGDARPATAAKAAEINKNAGTALGGANSDWALIGAETVRYFLAGAKAPEGGVAANPEQRAAMLDPLSAGWIMANSELIRYFVPGATPPKDAQLASPDQKAAIDAGVPNEWYLFNVKNFRDFVAGAVPPEGSTRSNQQAGSDPIQSGDWALDHLQSFRFFVPLPGTFENAIPDIPPQPEPRFVYGQPFPDLAQERDPEITLKSWREGLLIKREQTKVRTAPQYRMKTEIPRGWTQITFTTYENRAVPIHTDGKVEMVNLQVPVKNYDWKLVEFAAKEPVRERYSEDWREVLVTKLPDLRASEISSLAAASGERPSSFQGDSGSGSGSNTALAAAKLRNQMGANAVKASEVALTAAEIEQGRKKAEEEARQRAEEEAKQRAAEEAERKRQREEEARKDQERRAAEAAAEAAARVAAEAAERAAQKAAEEAARDALDKIAAANAAKDQILKTAIAQAAFGDVVKAAGYDFGSRIDSVLDKLTPFNLGNEAQKEIDKRKKELLKDYDDKLKDLEKDYDKKAKDIKDLVALNALQQEYQKKLNDLKKSMDDKVKDTHKLVSEMLVKHVDKGGTMRTGEEPNVNGKSVKAFYSHDTGRWVLLAYSDKDYKGEVTVLDSGNAPRMNGKDTPILPEFNFNGVKLTFKVDYTSYWPFGSSYDARVDKK